MRLRHAGALITLLVAAVVGAGGLYAISMLLTSALHPTSLTGLVSAPKRVMMSEVPRAVTATAPQTAETGAVASTVPPPASAPVEPTAPPPQANAAQPQPADLAPADPRIYPAGSAPLVSGKRAPTILQIGDSHTSADFLSGELRRRLQARYGRGGPGYLPAGRPHVGVLSSSMTINASAGWTYKSLQRPDANPAEFWLSGYTANATQPGETITYTSGQPITFDMIEIEVVGQPGGGAIDIALDGKVETHYDLAAKRIEPVAIRIQPNAGPTEKVKQISITTTGQGNVTVASVVIYNNHSGLTYDSVGYVGAQVSLINKFSDKLFADDLTRLDPQIVVVSFGTNEASNEGLSMAAYAKSYEHAISKIRAALPRAVIVAVSPPDFNELSPQCHKDKVAEATCQGGAPPPPAANAAAPAAAQASDCIWHTPAKLQQIRDVQRDIAKRMSLVYWNWASIMPSECGAHKWFAASPPLMSKDHVHFTIAGYKKSAEQLLNVLIPVVEKARVGANAVSNN